MFRARTRVVVLAALAVSPVALVSFAQTGTPREPPAVDPVAALNAEVRAGSRQLVADETNGYLRSVLSALSVPIESQLLVYSETSRQRDTITFANPRAIYFNDTTAVGWVPGGDGVEVATIDRARGLMFYVLDRQPSATPQFAPGEHCLQCHLLPDTGGAASLQMMSVLPLSDSKYDYAQGWPVNDRTPFADRWGGWFVTGARVPSVHLGNVPVNHVATSYTRAPIAPVLASMNERLDTRKYLSPYSDVVALLVLGHQVQTTNALLRLAWDTRSMAATSAATLTPGARALVNEVVDSLLFVDAAPWPSRIQGSAGFAQLFSAQGPRDTKGRSLRDLDLNTRLFRYPCSYLIYSEAFARLPAVAMRAVYARLSQVLSGADRSPAYAHITPTDRRAIVEILRDTKADLPADFAGP